MPISLIILDINMPVVDGMQAAHLIKQRFDEFNECLIERNNLIADTTNRRLIVRPMLIHLTQFDISFQQFIR